MAEYGTLRVKTGLAEMLKGGVIMDVVDAEQARIAEDAGACAVMALERVPADIRRDGGVARMSDPEMIREIQEAVTIPVMAKCRIGHFAEAQILEALEIDYIDESEVLTPADVLHHVDKWGFTVPFVCGATNLGEALRRIAEGAAMIRTKGEAGTGDIVNAVTHMRAVFGAIRSLQAMRGEELYAAAKEHRAPYELVRWVAENGRLSGRDVHRRGHRDSGGRVAVHAARRRRGLRRLRHLQVGRPGDARQGDRRGDDPFRRSQGARRRLRGSRRADGRDLLELPRRERAARSSRLVDGSRAGFRVLEHRRDGFRRGVPYSEWAVATSRRLGTSGRAHLGRLPGSDDAVAQVVTAGLRAFESRLIHVSKRVRIGVLALQGAFREHAAALRALGADVVEVRLPEELDGLDGLVIPGGESTTIMRLAELYGLDAAIAPSRASCSGRAPE